MKKFLPLLIIVGILLIGGGVIGVLAAQKTHTTPPTTATKKQTTNSNVFGSIQEALTKQLSLQCNFTDDQGRQTIAYIKAGAVRANITSTKPEEGGNVIVKDKKVYFWNTNTKQGFMMTLSEDQMKQMQQDAIHTSPTVAQKPAANQGTSMIDTLEKFKDHCKPAAVDDSFFVIPTDISFQDMSTMMHNSMQQITPAQSMTPEQYQQMMQKYAPPISGTNQ